MARTADTPTSTPKSRRRRSELIEAARCAFESNGYVETSVTDIVRIAGGSRASFYSYFSSKDDVLLVLVDDLVDDLFEAATHTVDAGLTAFERLVATIGQFMRAYADRAQMLLVLDQATTVDENFLGVRRAIRDRFASALQDTLAARWRSRPDSDGLDPELTAFALGGMVEDLARSRFLLGRELDDQESVRTLAVLWARVLDIDTNSSP